MHGVLHLSDSTYKNDQHLEQPQEGFSVGYHLYYGTILESPAKKSQGGEDGYGNGNAISINHVDEGCIHAIDGVFTCLKVIMDCFTKGITTLTVLTTDPYISRVARQWMPSWTLAAVKGNHQTIPHATEWLAVKNAGVKFIEVIEPTTGTNLADIYSLSYKEWDAHAKPYSTTAVKFDPLFWLPGQLFRANEAEKEYRLIKVAEHLEIGNMDTNTVYGVVISDTEQPLINTLLSFDGLTPHRPYTLNLPALSSDKTSGLLIAHGTKILSKLQMFSETWSIGRTTPVISEVDPPNKLYQSDIIFNTLRWLANEFANPIPDMTFHPDAFLMVDVTNTIFPNKAVAPEIVSGQTIKVPMPLGKPRKVNPGSEIPPVNTLRALLKKNAQLYTGAVNINGIWRYVFIAKHAGGVGVYTTWITKFFSRY